MKWVQSQPKSPNYYSVKALSGQNVKDRDFGNYVLGKTSGYKWDDLNEDGIWDKDNEPPLEGWEIKLAKQGDPAASKMLSTDKNGFYQFIELHPGKYYVSEELPGSDEWVQTYPDSNDGFHIVQVISRTDSKNNNFGNFKPGKKSGYKWNDSYPDGKWGPGEEPLPGWTIALVKVDIVTSQEKTIAYSVTDESGKYKFTGIHYGKYLIREILKPGWTQTWPAYEEEDGNLVPLPYEILVISGFEEENNNFGNWNHVSFGKTKGYWQTWQTAKRYTYDQMQVFVNHINANSNVYGAEQFGFGNLSVDEIKDRLMTNNNVDHFGGGTISFALARLEAQFLAAWLNIAAQFQDPDMTVYLYRVQGTPVDPVELYGASQLPLREVIRLTEEGIATYKEHGTGWSYDEFVTAQKLFTLINEAHDNTGFVFRPSHASRL